MVTGKPLFTVEEIQNKVKELADEISRDYDGKELLAVGILKGAFMFFSDIVRYIRFPISTDFLIMSSYVKTQTSGEIKIHADLREDIKDRHVLLIEDIADTGLSLSYLRKVLFERKPASLKICALLNKKERRQVDVPLDYVGFDIPDHYVVGYGLDYENRFRNLPYIAVFKKSD